MRSEVYINEDVSESQLLDLGFTYAIMEGGYMSRDYATIIIDNRAPYNGQIQQYSRGMEEEHIRNIERLEKAGLLKE